MKKLEVGKYRIYIEDKDKRKEIAHKAAQAKALQAQEKIKKALSEMLENGDKITIYSVAKKAGISYNTAKKYLKLK